MPAGHGGTDADLDLASASSSVPSAAGGTSRQHGLVCLRIAGSRSRSETSTGVAMKIEENVPAMIPMNRASEMSRSVPAPSSRAPMNRIPPTGSRATTEVLIERTRVWFTARLASSA